VIRPELGGIVGTIAVFVFFFIFAGDSGMFNAQGILNWSTVSAQFMIIAVGACMLMIAGEFDLSVGSMIGFAGMSIAILRRDAAVAGLDRDPSDLRAVHRHRRAQRLIVVRRGCRASS
jgi:ribose/xylose/arabinose/galactoside ABC-type transport system permease subunit